MRIGLQLMLAIIISFGCNDDNPTTDPNQIDCNIEINHLATTTGVTFYDESGNTISRFGTPNDISLINRELAVYPNPADDSILISSPNSPIVAFWIIWATCPLNCNDTFISQDDLSGEVFAEEQNNLRFRSVIHSEEVDNLSQFFVTTTTFDNGIYKVIVLTEESKFLWQNLIIHHELSEVSEIITYLEDRCR